MAPLHQMRPTVRSSSSFSVLLIIVAAAASAVVAAADRRVAFSFSPGWRRLPSPTPPEAASRLRLAAARVGGGGGGTSSAAGDALGSSPSGAKRKKEKASKRRAFGGGGAGVGVGGTGMGTRSTGAGRVKTNKKKKKGGGGSGGGPFDVAASLMRHEKLYDELSAEAAKALLDENSVDDVVFSEYVVAARCDPSEGADGAPPGVKSASDWVPVVQLCVSRPINQYEDGEEQTKARIRAAISAYRREICAAAALAAPIFNSLPRNRIQYGVEPHESFFRYVYEDVMEGKNDDETNDLVMTKREAREVLDLDPDCDDPDVVKRAYRTRSFEVHPDRFRGSEDRTEEEVRASSESFAKAKLAYETLRSGTRWHRGSGGGGTTGGTSWYESLGGRARTDFVGPVELLPLAEAKAVVDGGKFRCAVVGIEHDTVRAFVARNQAAAATAAALR